MKLAIGMIAGILAALAYNNGLHKPTWLNLNTVQQEVGGLIRRVEVRLTEAEVLPPTILSSGPETEPQQVQDQTHEQEHEQKQQQLQEQVQVQEPGSAPESGHPVMTEDVTGLPITSTFQVAWMPFRSETSATGFAEKLSQQLQRNFEIIKRGAGNYEVGFRYLTIEDRDQVLADIEQITGFQVPRSS